MKKISKIILCFNCIDLWKAFAIKSIPRSVFRNPLHQNKICLFSILVRFWFWFLSKTMTKQTVYLNNIARKRECRLHYLKQSAFLTHHCWRGLMTSPMMISLYDKSIKHCGKGENTGNQHSVLFPQCFQKASSIGLSGLCGNELK